MFVALIFLLLSNNSFAEVDEYQFCQVQIDSVKKFSLMSLKDLLSLKKSIALATSIEELNKFGSSDLAPMVVAIQEHQKISKKAAVQATIKLIKGLVIEQISLAINLQGIKSEKVWDLLFDKCVKNNLD